MTKHSNSGFSTDKCHGEDQFGNPHCTTWCRDCHLGSGNAAAVCGFVFLCYVGLGLLMPWMSSEILHMDNRQNKSLEVG